MSKFDIHTVYKTQDGEKVPSVTTVLNVLAKPALIYWAWDLGIKGIDYRKYRDDKADIGTLVHKQILDHLRGQVTTPKEYTLEQLTTAEVCFNKYMEWEEKQEMEPIMLEAQLVSEKHKFGGTPDNYCKLNGVLTIIDYKTSKAIYDENFYQLAGYKILLEEYGHSVEQCLILRIGRDETEGFEVCKRENLETEEQIFLRCVEIYHLKGGI